MDKKSDLRNVAIGAASFDTISRYGSGGAEFLKGLRGVDYETGFKFDRSLRDIANYKIHPDQVEKNIKQQAGFSAEIASVSKRNAKAIIDGKNSHSFRSEDLAGYGKNHNVVDIIDLVDGESITSQMKFVTDADGLLKKIAKGEGGKKNDYSRYLQVDRLDVPTEQVGQMKQICREQSQLLSDQAKSARSRGDTQLAEKLQKQSDNYKALESKVTDSGLTTEQAIAYRKNPNWETAKDIASVGHEAGIQGAKFGAVIGGSISLTSNIIALASGEKEFGEAVIDTAVDTLFSAGVGYGTAFTGTVIKTSMQQSSSVITRQLSKTGLPGMVVSTCLATGKTVARYAQGEINEAELIEEMGATVTGMVSGSMFTVIGQIAIPIPILGGLIGGMVGYMLTNTFYQSFFDVLKNAQLSAERRIMVEMQCEAAKAIAYEYEMKITDFFDSKLIQLDSESNVLFDLLRNKNVTADEFCEGMNRFASILGKTLSINNIDELDMAMLSDDPLVI